MSNNQYVFIWVVFRGKSLRAAHLLLIPGISHDVEPNMTNGPYASNQYPLPAVYKWFCKIFSSFSSFSCWVSSSFSSWVATSTTSLSSNTPPSRRNRRLIEVMRICDRKTDPAVEGSDRVTHCGVCHIRATNPSFSHCYLHIFFRGWNTLLHIHKSCLLPKKTDGLLGDPPALRYRYRYMRMRFFTKVFSDAFKSQPSKNDSRSEVQSRSDFHRGTSDSPPTNLSTQICNTLCSCVKFIFFVEAKYILTIHSF